MISNPLANPLFVPTLSVLASVLAIGLVGLVVAERHNLRALQRSVLLQRWLVWACIAGLYSLAVLSGSLAVLILLTALVVQAVREYGQLVGLQPLYRAVLLGAAVVMGPLAVWQPAAFFGVLPLLFREMDPGRLLARGGGASVPQPRRRPRAQAEATR